MSDPTQRWTRELGRLRLQADRTRRHAGGATENVTDAALTVCDSLLQELAGAHLENQQVRAELQRESAQWEHLFETMPVACVLTDVAGTIVKGNAAAGRFLNVTPKHLAGRELLLFVSDRLGLMKLLTALQLGYPDQRTTLVFRPRERRPRVMSALVSVLPGQQGGWLWFLVPCEDAQPHRQVPSDAQLTSWAVGDEVPPA